MSKIVPVAKKAEAAGSRVRLEQGKPLNFGNNRDQGPRMRNGALEVMQPGQGVGETGVGSR